MSATDEAHVLDMTRKLMAQGFYVDEVEHGAPVTSPDYNPPQFLLDRVRACIVENCAFDALHQEYLALMRRKGSGDNTPGTLMGPTELARLAGVDPDSLRSYVAKGLAPDFTNDRGTAYFLRRNLDSNIATIRRIKAGNLAQGARKRLATQGKET